MSGMDTRSMSRLMGITSLNDPGTHQDGSACPSPGDENVIDTLYEQEEEAMRRDGLAEELENESESKVEVESKIEESELSEFKTPHEGKGATPSRSTPTPGEHLPGLWAGSGGLMTKKFGIDEETLIEEEKRLELEMRHCEMILKRVKLDAMKNEISKLSLEKINKTGLSVTSDQQDKAGLAIQARRREMLKVAISDFKRGDADEAMNSIANFNVVLKACGLETVAYFEETGSKDEEVDLGTLVRRFVSKDYDVVASMRAEFGERGGKGSEMMRHLRECFINPLVYESTDAETELLNVDWQAMMELDGTKIKAALDKVWAITKLMPQGRGGTEEGWIAYVLDRTPSALANEYYRQMMHESFAVQQRAASSTRSFAVLLAKARNNMMRRSTMFKQNMLDGEPPKDVPPRASVHEKNHLDKGCPRCQLFGCAKAFKIDSECDVFGEPTWERVARIAKNEKYKLKVDTYRMEKKQDALVYETAPFTNYHACDFLSNKEYTALVDSLLDEEDDVEPEFSMYKCQMIKDGTYYSKAAEN